ncbi:uncharacterized protein EAE98_004106 [Botrytis deweyae]|uniref:Uncharacterized protein n=1 Tax=Botrytis deweyae TaxID=2478750 RepID=A0ABQ7ISN2_9HELO|nr:uncharacterized protein EAE98_004106 [Botrytis deweyae]KAF7932807.1 hypothetical protein EAE98_004106 [Botrytis deweyae]
MRMYIGIFANAGTGFQLLTPDRWMELEGKERQPSRLAAALTLEPWFKVKRSKVHTSLPSKIHCINKI